MGRMLETFTVMLLFAQPCFLATLDDVCQYLGKDLVIHRNFKTGETLCCHTITCERGQEPVMCDRDDPWSTTCRSCPDGTYQPEATDSVDMLHCTAKTQCYGNLSARHEKSKTRDTHCVCDPRRGVCNPAGVTKNPRTCVKKTCDQGFRLTSNCVCEVCPENKIKPGKKICDRRNRLCRKKREISTSETDIRTLCPEDNPEASTSVAPVLLGKKTGDVENLSPSSVVPYLTLLVDDRPSKKDHLVRNDVPKDDLNDDVSGSQLKKDMSWSYFCIVGISVLGIILVIICLALFVWRRGYLCSSNRASPSSIKETVSPKSSSSTDDVEMDDIVTVDPANTEASPLMSQHSDELRRLNALRPSLVQKLFFDESLWSILLSNETVTPEVRTTIEAAGVSHSAKAGALITYLLKRNSQAFTTFVSALIYSKQAHLAEELDPVLTMEILENCKEDDQLEKFVLSLSNNGVCMGTSHS